MSKSLVIFGSTSVLTLEILDRAIEEGYGNIVCYGRKPVPSIYLEDDRFSYVYHNPGEQELGLLGDLPSLSNLPTDSATVLYLPSYQTGRMPLTNLSDSDIYRTVEITLILPMLLVQRILENFKGHISVVLVSSQAAKFGGRNISAYAAAKGGIESFVKGMGREFGELGRGRINAISPGLLLTATLLRGLDEPSVERLKATVPLGRLGTAKDFADLFFWLTSDEASYVNGATIDLTGGR